MGAHVPETALREPAAAATAAAVNISLTVTAAGVEAGDSDDEVDEEDGDGEGTGLDDGGGGGVVGEGLVGAEEGADGEEEEEQGEESRRRSGVGVTDDDAASRGLARVGQQQPVGGKRRWEDGGSVAAATPALGIGGLQPEVARAVERAVARTARMGRREPRGGVADRGSRAAAAGASAAAGDAAASARLSYNDQMITGQGDEAAARQLQLEMVEQAAAAAAPSQRAAAKKGTKLTGKALIRKQLGLR